MASENLVNDLFEIVQSNTKEKLSYDDFEKDLVKSINLPNDEMDRALSIMLSQAEVNPNVIGESKGGSFVISPSFSASVVSTIKYENQFIEGKAENAERNLINNKSDAMLEAAFAANIIMTPELVDNMIQNYSSLSLEERDALWSKALTMDRETLTSLREAHNKKIMEYAEKADPETAKKLMETVVENEDKAATADALEDGKKSAKVDIVERINNQLKSKELDFDSILMKIAASLNVSYVPGMDLNTLPLIMLQRVSKVLEIIEKRVSEYRMEGKKLDDFNISLDFGSIPKPHKYAQEHTQGLNEDAVEHIKKVQNARNGTGYYTVSNKKDYVNSSASFAGIAGSSFTLTITANEQVALVHNERIFKQLAGEKFSPAKAKAQIEEFQESLNGIEGDESQKTTAMIVLNEILGKLDSEKMKQPGFGFEEFIELEIARLSSDKKVFKSIIIDFIKDQKVDYFLSMFRENPVVFRNVVLNGLVELRESDKDPEKFFGEYFRKIKDNTQGLVAYDIETYEKTTDEVGTAVSGKEYVPERAVDKYVERKSESLVVDKEALKKKQEQIKGIKPIKGKSKTSKEDKTQRDETDEPTSVSGKIGVTYNYGETGDIIESVETYGGAFPSENADMTFDANGMVDFDAQQWFGDYSSWLEPLEPTVLEKPKKDLTQDTTGVKETGDDEQREGGIFVPNNKEQVKTILNPVRLQQVKTEADIIRDTMKDLDDIIKEAEEELGE